MGQSCWSENSVWKAVPGDEFNIVEAEFRELSHLIRDPSDEL